MPMPLPRARLAQAVRVIGLVVLVGFVAQRVDPAVVAAQWRGMSAAHAAMVGAAFCFAMALRIGKWSWQLRCLGLRFEPVAQARNFLMSVLLGAVTPMRVGELYRLTALQLDPARRSEQLALATASLLLEKGYEVLVLLVLVCIGAAFTAPLVTLAILPVLAVGFLFGLGEAAPPAWLERRLPARLRTWAVAPLLQARDGLPAAARWGLLGLTAAAHLSNLVGGLGIYRAFGPMPASIFLFRMPLVTLTNVLPVSVGGIGMREAAAMEIFGGAGFPPSSAAVAASLMFLGANLLPALALVPLAFFVRRRPGIIGNR